MRPAKLFSATLALARSFETDPLRLARFALDDARGHLLDYAQSGDDPAPSVVDAADLLDRARDALGGEVAL